MLYDPGRHESLRVIPWDEARVRRAIDAIVVDTEDRYDARTYWPIHPQDLEPGESPDTITTPLYHGACGVFWGLRYLQRLGFARLVRSYDDELDTLLDRNREWLKQCPDDERASYLMGDTPIRLLAFDASPTALLETELERLIVGNVDHPSRELMWGAPGTMLAALFLHEKTGHPRWAEAFRLSAQTLWDQLEWSDAHRCFHWTQQLYGRRSTYIDAVHGFVATALPLIRGRSLLATDSWAAWETRIVETVGRTALREAGQANWSAQLDPPRDPSKKLVQFCHGSPGFIVCLADLPSRSLDTLLLDAGATVWTAGPLTKGSNLCHGTGGNGYAFLKLHRRFGDGIWLERARAFAMHGIEQTDAAHAHYGQSRYSLWSGDVGFAIYLVDCLRAEAAFPALDVFC